MMPGCFVDTDHCMGDVRTVLDGSSAQSEVSWCEASDAWAVPEPNANVTIPAGMTAARKRKRVVSIA